MNTAIVMSTRGFGVFRHDLLVDPGSVRFIGIFSEQDAPNLTDEQRQWFDQVHVVPCGVPDPTPLIASLVDAEAARRVIRDALTETDLDHLSLHSYDEQNVLLAAQLRTEFGIRGATYDQILPFRDKLVMKDRVRAAGVRVPRFGHYRPEEFAARTDAYFEEIVAEVGLPFILKPIDSAGAEGVHKVTSLDDFRALPADLGRDYEYEEFISGTMYSVNIVSKDRRTVFGGVTEYLVNSFDVQAGRVNADINLIDHDPRVARMVRFAERALDALGWPDGGSHLELFLTRDDELVFLEVAARFKGMAGLAAMQRNYGIAFVNLAFELETGIASRPYDDEQVYCFDGVVPKQAGVVDRLVEPELESEYAMTWKVKPGDEIVRSNSLLANGGTFLVWNKDYDMLYRDFQRLAAYQPIIYQEPAALGRRAS